MKKLQRFHSWLCFGEVKSEAGTQPASNNRCKKNSDFDWSNMVTWCSKIKQEVGSADTETVKLLLWLGTCVSIGEKNILSTNCFKDTSHVSAHPLTFMYFIQMLSGLNEGEQFRTPSLKSHQIHNLTTLKRSCEQAVSCTFNALRNNNAPLGHRVALKANA